MQPDDVTDAEAWFERADRDLQMATLALNADPMLGEGLHFMRNKPQRKHSRVS